MLILKEITLKKVLSEKYGKKRVLMTLSSQVMKLHTFWNEVPLKQMDYQSKIRI